MIIKCKHNIYIYNLGINLLGIIIVIDYTQIKLITYIKLAKLIL